MSEANEPDRSAVQEFVSPTGVPTKSLLRRIFIGPDGLRAGWSLALFVVLFGLFLYGISFVVGRFMAHGKHVMTPLSGMIGESIPLTALLAAGAIVAWIEGRSLTAYNLVGPRRFVRFAWGCLGGFLVLSALIGSLYLGGWIRFGPREMSAPVVVQNGLLWGIAFLFVGLFEEGLFRCYLLFTLTRGFGSGKVGFYCAAVVSSILFGAIHISNNGESQIGVFSTAAIGFVFCLSVRWTGSVWWAVAFHGSWDWAQTFFYGAADSGLVAQGHWLSVSPAGPVLWSGSATGPEGSLLVVPLVLLILLGLYLIYGRKHAANTGPVSHSLL